jgi:hypothetical protein
MFPLELIIGLLSLDIFLEGHSQLEKKKILNAAAFFVAGIVGLLIAIVCLAHSFPQK